MNFAGTWARDPRKNENVIWGLIERGVPPEEAKSKAEGPYRQTWKRKAAKIDEANGIGIVSKEVFLREPDRN